LLAATVGAGVDVAAGVDDRCSPTPVQAAATNRKPTVASRYRLRRHVVVMAMVELRSSGSRPGSSND